MNTQNSTSLVRTTALWGALAAATVFPTSTEAQEKGLLDRIKSTVSDTVTNTKQSIAKKLDPYWNGNEVREAERLWGTPLSKYPGVHQDKNLEKLEQLELPEAMTCRYHLSSKTDPHPVYLLMLGNRQQIDDNVDTDLLELYYKLCRADHDAMVMTSGIELARPKGKAYLQSDVMYQHMVNRIHQMVQAGQHTFAGMITYSWSNGMVQNAMCMQNGRICDLEVSLHGVPLKYIVGIDPVRHGTFNLGRTLPQFTPFDPNTTKIYWFYQGNDSFNEALDPLQLTTAPPKGDRKNTTVIRLYDHNHDSIDAEVVRRQVEIFDLIQP